MSADRELFVRFAHRDDRPVARLRAIDRGVDCIVEADVWPPGTPAGQPVRTGSYAFRDAGEATRFVTSAVEALIALGCDVRAAA